MANNEQILAVSVEARISKLEKEMKKASGIVGNNFSQMERRTKQAGDRMERSLRNSTANINGLLKTLGVGIGLNELRKLAETWTDLTSRVNIAVGSQERGAKVMQRVSEIARRTYSDLGQTAEAYISNSTAMKELGYSTQTQLDYTEALNNALVVSGAKGQRAESVMNALSKAMAFGELRGENLNTVIASGGRVVQALAQGLGVTTLELRAMGAQGKLTSDVVVKALTSQLGKLRAEADAMPATISDALVLLKNSMVQYVGKVNEARGVTSILSDGIIMAADNIDSIAAAAAAAGLAILGGYVPAIVRATVAQAAMVATNPFLLMVAAIGAATFALSAFGDEIKPVEGDLATLHDYAGAAWDSMKDSAAVAASAIGSTFMGAINLISSALDGAEINMDDLAAFAKKLTNSLMGSFGLLYDSIVIVFTKLPQAIAESVLNGMNALIEGVENGLNKIVESANAVIDSINIVGEKVGVSLATIDSVTLGRIENSYAGAGAAAGEAYAEAMRKASADHLGAWRDKANERAKNRTSKPDEDGSLDSTDNVRLPSASGAGSKASKTKADRGTDYERQVARVQANIAALRVETGVRREATGSIDEQERAVERARMAHELLNVALVSGEKDTPELRASIATLTDQYSQAAQEAEALARSQYEVARAAEDFRNLGKDTLRGFISDLGQGVSALDALGNALGRIADKLADMALGALLSNAFDGGGNGASYLSAAVSLFGYEGGGYTGGRGTSEVAGVVHGKEFVVHARATAKHRPLLEAINRGVPGYSEGGFVSATPSARAAGSAMGGFAQSNVFQISAPVTVNGSSGSPEQNDDLARKMAREMEANMRGVVSSEIAKQTRPGNVLNNRGR